MVSYSRVWWQLWGVGRSCRHFLGGPGTHCGVVLGVDLSAGFAEALAEFRPEVVAVHCLYGEDFLPIGTPQYLVAGVVSLREVPA